MWPRSRARTRAPPLLRFLLRHFLLLLLLSSSLTLASPWPPRRTRIAPPPLYRTAPPARIFTPNAATHYESIYRSFLTPLSLYTDYPSVYAPLSSPRGRDRLSSAPARYVRMLHTHPAYISPRAGEPLTAIVARIHALLARDSPVTRGEQRSLLALLEDSARQSRRELQNPLHPENVSAQHRVPIEQLRLKYRQMLQLLGTEANVGRLTDQLSVEENQRFVDVHEVLNAEEELLGVVGKSYAGVFPHLH